MELTFVNKILTNEERITIREKLKKAAGYPAGNQTKIADDDYKSETHHEKRVPFEGTVHFSAGYGLDTKNIHDKYKRSLSAIWWIIAQSMIQTILRASNRVMSAGSKKHG
jgi:hypothetical protein